METTENYQTLTLLHAQAKKQTQATMVKTNIWR